MHPSTGPARRAQGLPAAAADDRTPARLLPAAPDLRARVLDAAGRPCTCRTDPVLRLRGGVRLPTVGDAARIANVRAHPWLALSIIEGEHDDHAAVLTEGPAEVLATVPEDVLDITELRNRGGSLAWATTWIRMSPQRLFSFAEHAWPDVSGSP